MPCAGFQYHHTLLRPALPSQLSYRQYEFLSLYTTMAVKVSNFKNYFWSNLKADVLFPITAPHFAASNGRLYLHMQDRAQS